MTLLEAFNANRLPDTLCLPEPKKGWRYRFYPPQSSSSDSVLWRVASRFPIQSVAVDNLVHDSLFYLNRRDRELGRDIRIQWIKKVNRPDNHVLDFGNAHRAASAFNEALRLTHESLRKAIDAFKVMPMPANRESLLGMDALQGEEADEG